MSRRIVAIVLTVVLTAGVFSGCGSVESGSKTETVDSTQKAPGTANESQDETEAGRKEAETESALSLMKAVNDQNLDQVMEDSYRTFYEIFLYSFYDSDGDGIGDLAGATKKLDYLNDGDEGTDTDLGINGIWLMPIMPSPSYHKYDVTDYEAIDPVYGTMEDFKTFLAECKKRDINVIIDLVMNHTSSDHPWFTQACEYLRSLPLGSEPDLSQCPYVDYYHFTREKQVNFHQVEGTDWYYEGQFWEGMPDLNMESELVQKEFDEITSFWLDMGVAGFRLDAVGEYESDNSTASIAILQQFMDMVKTKAPDSYTVGEIWSDMNTYTQYYQGGIDSCFDFSFGDSTGIIANTLKGAKGYNASSFGKAQVNIQDMIQKINPQAIDAPFYTNHDMARGAGYYSGEYSEAQTKMAQAMNLLMSGNAFLYYGEELGMKGSGKDENKRAPMYWSEDKSAEGSCVGPADMDSIKMKYGSLDTQQADGASIYNFVKQVIRLRNKFPQIARGTVSFVESCSNNQICTIRKSYEESELVIVYNLSEKETTMDISETKAEEIKGILLTGKDNVTYEAGTITMPAYSAAILQ